jgi:phosphatidylglycerophosphatase A
MTENSLFLCFKAVFVNYCPLFWGSIEIYKEYYSMYILERNGKKKLIVFAYFAIFVSYCPQFWSSGVIYKAQDTLYMFERHDQKLVIFAF